MPINLNNARIRGKFIDSFFIFSSPVSNYKKSLDETYDELLKVTTPQEIDAIRIKHQQQVNTQQRSIEFDYEINRNTARLYFVLFEYINCQYSVAQKMSQIHPVHHLKLVVQINHCITLLDTLVKWLPEDDKYLTDLQKKIILNSLNAFNVRFYQLISFSGAVFNELAESTQQELFALMQRNYAINDFIYTPIFKNNDFTTDCELMSYAQFHAQYTNAIDEYVVLSNQIKQVTCFNREEQNLITKALSIRGDLEQIEIKGGEVLSFILHPYLRKNINESIKSIDNDFRRIFSEISQRIQKELNRMSEEINAIDIDLTQTRLVSYIANLSELKAKIYFLENNLSSFQLEVGATEKMLEECSQLENKLSQLIHINQVRFKKQLTYFEIELLDIERELINPITNTMHQTLQSHLIDMAQCLFQQERRFAPEITFPFRKDSTKIKCRIDTLLDELECLNEERSFYSPLPIK